MKLAIVIIHYNTSGDLDRCLESINTYAPAADHRVIVVDNASDDAGLAEVHRRYPDCQWVFNAVNAGYSAGCNLGMAQVEADYYLILNPDIVVQPGALDRLLEFADAHPRAGMVGPQLLNEDGSIQDSCRRFYTFKTLLMRRTFLGRIFPNSQTVSRHLMLDFDHRSSRPVDWILGGCMLVRRSAMDRTGPMDERFFLYFEDVDWCYRMWQAGFEVRYTPDARFMHRHRRSSAKGRFNKSFWSHLGSLISFYEKWGILVWLLKKWRGPLMVFLLWLMDMIGVTAAFGAAYGLRGALGALFQEPLFPFAEYRPLLYFTGLLVTATFLMAGRYRRDHHRHGLPWIKHLQQVGIVAVLALAATYLGHLEVVSRAVLLMFIPLLAITTAVGEGLFRRLLRRLEKGHLSLERTLLVGDPQRIRHWLETSGNLATQGVDVAGYVADPTEAGGGLPAIGGGDVPWLGPRQDLLATVGRYRISQVVFWDRPGQMPDSYAQLAGLRRLHARLRWHVDDVWLLAAGARAELFGTELSGVAETRATAALRALGDRLLGITAGLGLGLLGLPNWLWLRTVRIPRGTARLQALQVSDLWGHAPTLTFATAADGRILSLIWQWRLAFPLLCGRLNVSGPRPVQGQSPQPESAAEVAAFWHEDPCAPGLTGAWARNTENLIRPTATATGGYTIMWQQLWSDPGGFGTLDMIDDQTLSPTAISRSGGEVS